MNFYDTHEPYSLLLIRTLNTEKHERRSFWFSWKNSLQVNKTIKTMIEKRENIAFYWFCSIRWNVILQDREILVDCCKWSSKIAAVTKKLPAKILGFMPVFLFSFILRNPAPAGRFVCLSSNEPFILDNDVQPIKNLTEIYEQRIERGQRARELLKEAMFFSDDRSHDIINWFTYDKYGGMFWDYAQGNGNEWSEDWKIF